jgi:2-polyprenyl-6-methoxyphenol hydroxylase-like FAD-dependent oxidoreductase
MPEPMEHGSHQMRVDIDGSVAITKHAVVIVGGGPTGLMLAGELALAGIDVAIVERRPSQNLAGSRAGGLHSRTIEVLDQRGIADRFLSEGQKAQVGMFAGARLDISDFPTRHNYGLGKELTGFAQDDTGVDVELSDGQSLRAEYLIGCDGGRSLIRKAAGIEFPGWDPTTSSLIAEVEMTDEPELGIHRDAFGIHAFGRKEYEIRDGEVVYKCAGCSESGMEAGSGGQRDIAGKPPGYLSCRAPPGRCPRVAQHDGVDRASSPGRPHEGTA